MGGKMTAILFLVLFVLLAITGMIIAVDLRLSEINRELEIKITVQQAELEEIKKKQRITAQDVYFLEKRMEEL